MIRRLTPEEKSEIITRYVMGESSLQLSEAFKISKPAILRVLRNNHIERRSCRKFDDLTENMISMYSSGVSACEISDVLGMSSRKVYKTLEENGICRRDFSNAKQTYYRQSAFFDDISSESQAYFFGLLYADGSVSNSKTNFKLSIQLQETDKHILESLCELIIPGKSPRFVERPCDHPNWSNLYSVCVDDKYMVTKLRSHGLVSDKTRCRTFPEIILKSNEEIQRHFIRGYFDGDGSIYYKKKEGKIIKSTIRVTFASNFNMCENIGNIIKMYCNSNYIISNNGNSNHITFMGRLKVMRILDWLYKDSTYYLHRKYAKYEELKELIDSGAIP
mgnify:CR=1 FL=1